MRHLSLFLAISDVVFLGAAARAQSFTPVKAEVFNQLWKIRPDGTRELTVDETGYFIRSANGTELRRITGKRDKGELRNLAERKTYTIDYARRIVFLNMEIPAGIPMSFRDAKPPPPDRVIGEEMVSGIRCVKIVGKDRTRQNLTVASLDYDLLVRSEAEYDTPQGERFLVVNGLRNIQLGIEPDSAQLAIPNGFQLLKREGEVGTTPCSACERPGARVPNR